MASDVATIAGGVTVLAGAATAASIGVVLLRRPKPYLTSGHALVGMRSTDPLTLDDDDIEAVARQAESNPNVRANPRPVSEADARAILEAAF